MPPVRGIHIYSSKEWLYYFTYCLTLGIDFKLQCTCLKFCHRKNKKIIIFYIIYKFPWQLYSDSVSSHWYKTTFVLEYDNRNNMQFPSNPRKRHTSKTRLKCFWYSWLTRSAQTAGRVLGFSSGICLNDMFKQQQAKQPWRSFGQNCADSLQDKAEKKYHEQ